MKKHIFFLGLMSAATLTLTNCTKEIDQPVSPEKQGYPFEIFVSSPKVKTVNSGMATEWASGDEINLFHAVSGTEEYIDNENFIIDEDGLASGAFKGELKASLENGVLYDWYAFYPYNKSYNSPASTSSGVTYIGSKYNEAETQDGNDNKEHLAGKHFQLCGKVKEVDASIVPSIEMVHLTSAVEVVVKNTTGESLIVNEVRFTAPEDIVGSYYISFAGDDVVYKQNTGYAVPTATLNVKNASPIANNGSASFYIGFKPFTASANSSLTLSVNGYEKTITLSSDVTFHPGKIKTLNFNFDKIPSFPIPYEESFSSTLGDFMIKDKTLDEGLSYVWNTNTNYVKASAYASSTNYAAESWLVSPYLDLSLVSSAYLSFEHAVNYFTDINTAMNQVKVMVSEEGGDWEEISIDFPETQSWNFVHSGFASLAAHCGKKIQVAFVYTSTSEKAGTWEIKNFKVDLKKDQILSFAVPSYTLTQGIDDIEGFTGQEVSGAQTTVTYSSDNASVASVDPSTGKVTLGSVAGTATITATAAASSSYKEAVATYTIELKEEPVAGVYTIEFGPRSNSQSVSNYTTSWSVTCNSFTCNMVNM